MVIIRDEINDYNMKLSSDPSQDLERLRLKLHQENE